MNNSMTPVRATALAVLALGTIAVSGVGFGQEPAFAKPGSSSMRALKNCVAAVSGAGRGRFRGFAEMEAKDNWRSGTAGLWGQGYADWNRAQNQDVTCGHDGKPIKTWTCTAIAEPCNDAALPSPTPTPTPQPACYPSIAIEGNDAKLQTGAETYSIAAWRAQAASYGAVYQDWNKAVGKDITCRHNGLGPLQRRWRCVATGQPCK